MAERYKVIRGTDAREQKLPGFEHERGRYDDDWVEVLYRCDDAGTPIEVVATDRMEPEDVSFGRDLGWIPVVLNQQADEIARLQRELAAERLAHAETRRQLETANLTLRQCVDFVRRERALRDAHGKGGQHTGASPRISPSVLHELERFIAHAPGTVEWVGDKLTAAEARLRAAEALVREVEGMVTDFGTRELRARLAAWLEGR